MTEHHIWSFARRPLLLVQWRRVHRVDKQVYVHCPGRPWRARMPPYARQVSNDFARRSLESRLPDRCRSPF